MYALYLRSGICDINQVASCIQIVSDNRKGEFHIYHYIYRHCVCLCVCIYMYIYTHTCVCMHMESCYGSKPAANVPFFLIYIFNFFLIVYICFVCHGCISFT